MHLIFTRRIIKNLCAHPVAGFAGRLLLPILLIYCLPAEENILQNLFQGEGLLRIFHGAWPLRSSLLRALKATTIGSVSFVAEEVLQAICLWYLL